MTPPDSIKSLVERKDDKGQDTFEISDWWKVNCAKLPAFTYVLCAVLTNSHNSCSPERLFTIFNSTFDADQKSSYDECIQLSMESQFNNLRQSNTLVVECLEQRGNWGNG
jgi:hypothetical protein